MDVKSKIEVSKITSLTMLLNIGKKREIISTDKVVVDGEEIKTE